METKQPTDSEKINQILLNQLQLQQLITRQSEQLNKISSSLETLGKQMNYTTNSLSPFVRLDTSTSLNDGGLFPNCEESDSAEESDSERQEETLEQLVFFFMFGYSLLFLPF